MGYWSERLPLDDWYPPRRRLCDENVGQSSVRAEPRHQAVTAVAAGSTATLAVDTHDVEGKFAERM